MNFYTWYDCNKESLTQLGTPENLRRAFNAGRACRDQEIVKAARKERDDYCPICGTRPACENDCR